MSTRNAIFASAIVILTLVPAVRAAITRAQVTPATTQLTSEQRAAWSTYLTQCSQCPGTDANGTAAAANLRAFKGSEDDFLRIVRDGRAGTAMTRWKGLISAEEIRNMAR